MSFWDLGLGGSTNAKSVLFGPASALMKGGGSDGGGVNINDLLGIIDQYSYKPQYTGQTEKQLYDLFGQLTGTSGQGVNGIPFDIGLPTTGLYDALTRGIKEDYLGTPGGPESGRLADTRAYYNNMGVPTYAANQERLGNRDLNNSLFDTAAKINESQKDRLTNVLNIGAGVGTNLYGQNLAQHRANAGLGMQAAGLDVGVQDAIRQSNQTSLNDLLSGVGTALGTVYGGPAGGAAANYTINNLFGQNGGATNQVSRGGALPTGGMGSYLPYALPGYSGTGDAKLIK